MVEEFSLLPNAITFPHIISKPMSSGSESMGAEMCEDFHRRVV